MTARRHNKLKPRLSIELVEPADRGRRHATLMQAFALRHRVFVEERGWEFLRNAQGYDRDSHDSGAAIHIVALTYGETVGHVRIIPGGYLAIAEADSRLVAAAVGDATIDGLSRFCLVSDLRTPLREAVAVRLFSAALHHVLDRGNHALLFDTDPSIVFMLRALGFSLYRVGEPAPIAGRLMEPVVLRLDASVLSALPMRIAAWGRRWSGAVEGRAAEA